VPSVLPAVICDVTLPSPISPIGVEPPRMAVTARRALKRVQRIQSAPLSRLRLSMKTTQGTDAVR